MWKQQLQEWGGRGRGRGKQHQGNWNNFTTWTVKAIVISFV